MARGLLSLVLWGLISVQVVLVIATEQQAKLVSSVSVEGLVFCDQCLQDKVMRSSNLLKGAKVAVVCESKSPETAASPVEVVATTDSKGQFKAELPKSAFDNEGQISCTAELRESPRRSCQLQGISSRTSSAFNRQDSSSPAIVYAAGALSFRPKSAGLFCAQASYSYTPSYSPPVYQQSPPKYNSQPPPVYQSPPDYQQSQPPPVYQQSPPDFQQSQPPPVYQQPPPEFQQSQPPPEQQSQPPPQQQSEPPPQQQSEPPPQQSQPPPSPPYYKPKYKYPKFSFPKFKLPKLSFPKFKLPPRKKYYPKPPIP